MKHVLITILMLVLPFTSALYVAGCSSKYGQVTKPDGTEIIVELKRTFTDDDLTGLTITVDPDTGKYTFTVDRYESKTSPFIQDMMKLAYEAGRAAR
jgi:hypothetical protein